MLGIGVMAFQLAEAFKFPALNVIITGSWMVLAIPLMIVAADVWQAEGVAWARFAAVLVTIPIVAYAERRFLGGIQWRFWFAVGFRVLLAAGVMAAVDFAVLSYFADSYLSLVMAGMLGAAAFAGVLAATRFLTGEDLDVIRRSLFRRSAIQPEV
jgi:hypothetical protein